ncbi:BCCT family transporter [Nosocomiicoccus ampullae]|nr:BCCT family transporter [Nosocomiicoccus ampullae]QYA48259.1 BCCT family transporter [Nosocomiicoccus ampullae]
MSQKKRKKEKPFTPVFTYGLIVVLILVFLGVLMPNKFYETASGISGFIAENLGWYYMFVTTGLGFFAVFIIFSPIGKLKLGQPHEKPEFSTISWFAMLFSAGMGIGLVFWSAAEPMNHMMNPPTGEGGGHQQVQAVRSTIFHWGLHAWCVYGIVALALAYTAYRKGESGLISKTLRPIFGDKVDGTLGQIVDTMAVFATVIGVAVSLGMGALQINGGLNYLLGVPETVIIQGIIILVVTILFLISAWSGLSKGIQILSNSNMVLAVLLFFIILFVGPTIASLDMFATATGSYLQQFLYLTLDTGYNDSQKAAWIQEWTIYYWGWWFSWCPFVGIFIARVSRGRTIREFILAVILVPATICMLWFSVFGTTGMTTGLKHPHIFDLPVEKQLFAIFDVMPIGTLLSIIALVLVSVFFITSADSATFVLGMQTTDGSLTPRTRIKIVWGIALSLISYTLIIAGGENALSAIQAAAIIAALPFSVIVILMTISFFKDANNERKYLGLTLQPDEENMKQYLSSTPEEHSQDIQDYIDETSDQRGI